MTGQSRLTNKVNVNIVVVTGGIGGQTSTCVGYWVIAVPKGLG